uniref:Uncharacterized protein LOC113785496 n=1 Tax=Cicer arietinum TaxID=3827 RepID=A0A3Q7XM85_CICAR|nr:uncharacterized protein LOC113785496 [Cicer arietinum]
MEQNIPIIICKLECIFPPAFFDSMEHLPVHLPLEAKLGGLVQYRWMYPFERFINKIKKTVKNKKKNVEGCISEAYLVQEITYFSTHYFVPLAQYASTIGLNKRTHQDHVIQTLPIFENLHGETSGKCSDRWLNDKELAAAQLHVLLNCIEVKQFIEMYVQSLKSIYGDLNDNVIDTQIEVDFPRWFQEYVTKNHKLTMQNPNLYDLARGPLRLAKLWPIYHVNGYQFNTTSWGEGKITYNSGVCVKGIGQGETSSDYYGVVSEILEFEWRSQATRKLILFYCDWFDPSSRGMRIHNQYKIVEVRKGRKYGKFDPFISKSATQVYYSPYPGRQRVDWLVVMKTKPRGVVNDRHTLEVDFQVQESEVNATIEDDPIDNLQDDSVYGE